MAPFGTGQTLVSRSLSLVRIFEIIDKNVEVLHLLCGAVLGLDCDFLWKRPNGRFLWYETNSRIADRRLTVVTIRVRSIG